MTPPRFALGHICITPRALLLLASGTEEASDFLARHIAGDWGDLDEHDRRQNDIAVQHSLRILSAYTTSQGKKLWVITEADHSITTLLLPEEY
jgi:hypothetical protein